MPEIEVSTRKRLDLRLLAVVAALAGPGQALAGPEAPAPGGASPDATTETYGDWSLICDRLANSRICEVDATLTLPGQNAPIARIGFARPDKSKPIRLVVQTPGNILIAPGVKVEAEPGKALVALAYRACAPTGCFADADLSADQVKAFHGRTTPGQITLTDPAGKAFALKFSLRGLEQALDALAGRS